MKKYYFLLGMSSMFILSACGGDDRLQVLKEQVSKMKQVTVTDKKTTKETEEFKLPAPVTYGPPEGNEEAANPENVDIRKIAMNPFLAYPVSSYKFVGTLTQDNVTKAYVMAPNSAVTELKVGDLIGNNNGRIASIEARSIQIKEKILEAGKQPREKIVYLYIKD